MAMFLGILLATVVLHMAKVGGYRDYQCPAVEQMLPCECGVSMLGLYVRCANGRLMADQVRGPLAIAASTNQTVYSITLTNIWLPDLPPNLLVGQGVGTVYIGNSHTHSVHKDAFAEVAAKLDWLYIRDNSLTRVPSEALQALSNLRYLVLRNNRINALHAEAFKGLHSLLDLYMSGNRIKFIDNSAFVGIGNRFRELILNDNKLTAVPYLPIRNLSSLKYLDLMDNRVVAMLPEGFDGMNLNSLISLNLTNNTIRHVPPRAFKSLGSLYRLDLSRNAIESIHPLAFQGLEGTLEILRLGHNRLTEVPSSALKNLTLLRFIDLPGNKICKVRKGDFSPHATNLKYIHLESNVLKYIDTAAFVGLDSLERLYLQSNQLATAPNETYVTVLDTMQVFQINDNPLHCDCNLSWLQEWMKGQGFGIVQMATETKCTTPLERVGEPLEEIPPDQLVCGNETTKSDEPCCNCFTNTQQRITSDAFLVVVQIYCTYLVTNAVLTNRLF